MLGGQKVIFVFQTTCADDKKLSCGSVGGQESLFLSSPLSQFVQYQEQF
jgi:hypothetical protein